MSHELDDNVERRKFILALVPKKGFTELEFTRAIMSLGYNLRGARAKAKEMLFLRMVVKREGRIYAHTEESK